jgi:sirohydrochlorin cobaltochelatase
MDAVAAAIAARKPGMPVRCAFLELCEPSLPDAAGEMVVAGIRHITVFPLFFGVGKHAREDLPGLIAQIGASHPGLTMDLLPTAGEHAQLVALMADIAVSAAAGHA